MFLSGTVFCSVQPTPGRTWQKPRSPQKGDEGDEGGH